MCLSSNQFVPYSEYLAACHGAEPNHKSLGESCAINVHLDLYCQDEAGCPLRPPESDPFPAPGHRVTLRAEGARCLLLLLRKDPIGLEHGGVLNHGTQNAAFQLYSKLWAVASVTKT